MQQYKLPTKDGMFYYEVIESNNHEYVATITRKGVNRYLRRNEVPKYVFTFLKECGYKIELLNADLLNAMLGLS